MAKEPYTSDLMTRRGVERVFQLSPEPPAMGALNDYILAAKSTSDNNFFSYFLHHYEKQLNSRIYSFLQSDGSDQYAPERFLDLKLACAELLLRKLQDYDPDKGAAFTTYVYPYLEEQMLHFRMQEEACRSILWTPTRKFGRQRGCWEMSVTLQKSLPKRTTAISRPLRNISKPRGQFVIGNPSSTFSSASFPQE